MSKAPRFGKVLKSPPPTQIPVFIWISGGKVHVHPDPVHIRMGQNEEVMWRCDDGDATLAFKRRTTPFKHIEYHVPAGGGVTSGVPAPQVTLRRRCREAVKGTKAAPQYKFSYTVTVVTPRGIYKKDPGVIVDCHEA
jgi:hypothetical protein